MPRCGRGSVSAGLLLEPGLNKKETRIINLRDPRALLRCVLHGLSQATGTTSLTFTQPL